jgi:DHA1 family multidrug resistance protein-like MFS transporter
MRRSKIYSGSIFALSLASLVENIAGTMPSSYFPYYTTSLGAETWFLGAFIAAFLVTNAFLSSSFGGFSDRHGRKKVIQAGLIADTVLGTATGLVQNWQSLLIIRALNGTATAAVRPAAEASLVDQIPADRRGEAMGFFLTATLIGWFIGPIFGGTIQYFSETALGFALEDSYRIPYFVDSSLSVIALILINWKVKETRGTVPAKETGTIKDQDDVKLTGSVQRAIRALYVSSLTNGFAVGFIAPVGVLFLGAAYGAVPLQIGTILSVSGFMGVFCNFFAGKLADIWGRKPVIAIGGISSRLASFVLPFAEDLWAATCIMAFRSLGLNVSMPASRALRADLVPEKIRGKLFGWFTACFNTGMVAGSLLGPWLFDTYQFVEFNIGWLGGLTVKGMGLPFFVSAILGLLGLAVLLAFVKEPPRRLHPKDYDLIVSQDLG